jgi:hypothetical protein
MPGIVAMAAALKESVDNMEANTAKIIPMRDKLFAELSKIPHSKINGSLEHHVPGTVNMCFEGIEGESLLLYAGPERHLRLLRQRLHLRLPGSQPRAAGHRPAPRGGPRLPEAESIGEYNDMDR